MDFQRWNIFFLERFLWDGKPDCTRSQISCFSFSLSIWIFRSGGLEYKGFNWTSEPVFTLEDKSTGTRNEESQWEPQKLVLLCWSLFCLCFIFILPYFFKKKDRRVKWSKFQENSQKQRSSQSSTQERKTKWASNRESKKQMVCK